MHLLWTLVKALPHIWVNKTTWALYISYQYFFVPTPPLHNAVDQVYTEIQIIIIIFLTRISLAYSLFALKPKFPVSFPHF